MWVQKKSWKKKVVTCVDKDFISASFMVEKAIGCYKWMCEPNSAVKSEFENLILVGYIFKIVWYIRVVFSLVKWLNTDKRYNVRMKFIIYEWLIISSDLRV